VSIRRWKDSNGKKEAQNVSANNLFKINHRLFYYPILFSKIPHYQHELCEKVALFNAQCRKSAAISMITR